MFSYGSVTVWTRRVRAGRRAACIRWAVITAAAQTARSPAEITPARVKASARGAAGLTGRPAAAHVDLDDGRGSGAV